MVYLRFRFSESKQKYLLNIHRDNTYNIPIDDVWIAMEIDKYFNFKVKNVIHLLYLCVQNDADKRPTIDQVLEHPWFN